MLEQVLKGVEAESKDTHFVVAMLLTLYDLPGSLELAREARPDEGQRDSNEECGDTGCLSESGVFKVETSGFQRRMQILRLLTLGVTNQILTTPALVSEIQQVPGGVLRCQHMELHPVHVGCPVPHPHFGCMKLAKAGPQGHAVHLGVRPPSNTGHAAVLVEEGEPILADKLAICQQTRNASLSTHGQETFEQCRTVSLRARAAVWQQRLEQGNTE